jgi:hypothetical protein
MKQKILKQLCMVFCLLTSMSAFAEEVTIGDLKYELNGTEAYVSGVSNSTLEDIVIPASIESDGLTFKVTHINSRAFENNTTIKSVRSEGENLTSIGEYAFYKCTSLVSVSLPSVQYVLVRVFCGCTSLVSVSLPSVRSTETATFQGCTSLTTVNCPNLQTIAYKSFYGCTALTHVNFPYVRVVTQASFAECTSLRYVYLGGQLKSITIESTNTMERIGSFKGCSKLTYIILPASCTDIDGAYTFSGCSRLQAIIYLGTQTYTCGTNADVYNLNNMLQWGINSFNYNGTSPVPTYTCNLPFGFQPVVESMPSLQKDAGSYNIKIPITFANNDMSFTAQIPYSYTINPLTLTAQVKDATKVYGEANPQFKTEYSGFITGEDESIITNNGTYSTSATASSAVGTYSVTQSGVVAPNYTLQYTPGTLTVTKAPLTMAPRDKTMTYGDQLPIFDAVYTGLKNNESKPAWTTEPTIATTATATSNAGTYPITITNGVAKNYDVTFNQGTLTISKAALTATTKNATREYGDENPDFEFTYSGLKNGDEAPAWAVAPTFASPASKTSPVGTYNITATGGEAKNYLVQFVNTGKLTVAKAPLTAKARNYTKKQGEENPIFAVDYTGFKNDETKLALTQEPIATTSATRTSRPGTYEITVSGGIAMNYELEYINGTLTILPNENPGDQTDNVLTLGNVKGNKNSQVILPVALTNKHQITGLQMDLYLPEGVTVATNSKGKMLITTTDRMDGSYSISSNVIDNYVRIVGYSADGDAFSGESGDILNITLNIGDITDGDYTVRLKDIVLSDVNNTEYHPVDVGSVITVKSYTLGDVDNSGAININDVVCIINYILNKTNGTFIEEAADVDGSGTININDVVTLINRYILNKTSAKAFAIGSDVQDAADIIANNYLHLATINIAPGETKEVEMLMTNANNVSAAQGNIKLPQGISFVLNSKGKVDAKNIDARSEDFTLSCAIQADGSLTFAHYSADGYTYDGNEGGIFKFKIKADENATAGSYDIDLSGIVLSIDGVGYDIPNRSSSLIITGTDGILSIESNVTLPNGDYYTLDGMKIANTPKKKGIYIVNGKKVVVK